MSDNGTKQDCFATARRRAPTSLSAMGRCTLMEYARGGAADAEIPASPHPRAKVMIGNQALDRADITEGKPGIPLMLTLTILDAADGWKPIAGANVEIWHCDADGVYSDYASGVNPGSTATTYLRGVQTTDGAGRVTFGTIYPGWSSPRATHVDVRVYEGTRLQMTTQIGFPDAINAAVYTTELYIKGQSPISNHADPVFRNGTDRGGQGFQIAAVGGDNTQGYFAALPIAINRFA
jgi:protocatechuate 3,4-dioxygenase beta subunit